MNENSLAQADIECQWVQEDDYENSSYYNTDCGEAFSILTGPQQWRTKMNIQALMDGMSAQWQINRAETQMTLGKLIAALEAMPEGAEVANLNNMHSYRSYCSDLAFEQCEGTRLVTDLLDECKTAMGRVFCGYKGGDFVMSALTPVWVAEYGCCGKKLIALHASGKMETAEDD